MRADDRVCMASNERFADLGRTRRIWAVSSIHGHVERLAALHDDLAPRVGPGDRIVYLGNFLGHGPHIRETVDELLVFRRAMIARPGMLARDVVYLRGSQEEMWQKLLQLQFAPNPSQVLDWMLHQGVDATLGAYGGDSGQGLAAARDGAVSLTRWTNALRTGMRALAPGHETLMTALRRAAYTMPEPAPGVLFVHAGVDVSRPLTEQGDAFWWGGGSFPTIAAPYGPFGRVVRGYDPRHAGISLADHAASIDGGCGFGGRLACACVAPEGEILELIEA